MRKLRQSGVEPMSASFWHFVAWKAEVQISQTPSHIKFQLCFRFHRSAAVARDLILRSQGRERGLMQGCAPQVTVGAWGSGASCSGNGFLVLRSQPRQNSNFPKLQIEAWKSLPPQCGPAVPSGSHAQRPVYGRPSQHSCQHLVPLLNPFLPKSTICPLHTHPYKKHNLPFSHVPPSSK